jgi:hypothetical protein
MSCAGMPFYPSLPMQCIMLRSTWQERAALVLIALVLIITAGCSAPEQPAVATPAPGVATDTPLPATLPATPVPVLTTANVTPQVMTAKKPVNTTVATTVPVPVPTTISDTALNARIVDSRNKLEMFIDSNVADTVIVHADRAQGCEVKKSKELGYLIDMTSGESTFIKGDYWSIDGNLFSKNMTKDRQYIIIHTHPRMWVTCGGSGVVSLYSFSIGDLEAAANMTERGYHVKKLIAIADMDYRVWPYVDDGWKSEDEIHRAVSRIESRIGKPFSYYDPAFDQTFYDVDNLMPYLVKELDYHYTINNNVIN